MKRLSLQWRITLLTILLLAAACVTMKTLLCSSGHAYMDSIGNYVMHYAEEEPLAIRVDIPEEQWEDIGFLRMADQMEPVLRRALADRA